MIINPEQINPLSMETDDGEKEPISKDPWKHRSAGMRCETCMFYVPKKAKAGIPEIGRCRRSAPTMKGFPAVFPNDWCGEHKLDEEKLLLT